ncbi:fumarylacetoacetate hydrolase family protein [Salsuginibacillus kocurii]|uniref:fumarylacetoacetate hydrolase family protein n=1 Tax=Salsuginibacillus kocurii TaxID=427078 RepID=UPI000366EFC0|nr:fumarylacetoacetate hydrolase family protein [Salsuginibacillus kocurii]
MRIATVKDQGQEKAVVVTSEGVVKVESINQTFHTEFPITIIDLITAERVEELRNWVGDNSNNLQEAGFIEANDYEPLYRNPGKIWGIGLNYVDHASDLSEKAPSTEPASFMKPTTTIIGPNDTIEIPHQSERTTAEAELGIVIGKECKNVSEEEAIHYVAGYTTIIDMTAEDILEKNPRYLTRSKSFDTFFSFGPELVTTDEVNDVHDLNVSTRINGELHRKNVVSNMTFTPWNLVSFHSNVMTLKPGDIISTGTPGAIHIQDGDVVECHIDGFTPLRNNVRDLKQ